MNREQLILFTQAVRESTIKRLRLVPAGFENWRISKNSLNFAEIINHLVECDEWLLKKIENESLHSITPQVNSININDYHEFDILINKLKDCGEKREKLIFKLNDEDFSRRLFDDRFNAKVTIWWLIVRGNIDHEIYHRGQITTYLRVLKDSSQDK